MTFLRLSRTEWAALGVLLMATWYGSQWLAARDARVSGQASIAQRLDRTERKADALLLWAELVSHIEGWPVPMIPQHPIRIPRTGPDPTGEGPFAAQLDDENQGGCQ